MGDMLMSTRSPHQFDSMHVYAFGEIGYKYMHSIGQLGGVSMYLYCRALQEEDNTPARPLYYKNNHEKARPWGRTWHGAWAQGRLGTRKR